MSKLIASQELRDAHARLEADGRLGEHLFLLGKHLDEIKARRTKRATRYHRPTYDPTDPALEQYPSSVRPEQPAPVEDNDYLSEGLRKGLQQVRTCADEQRKVKARVAAQGAPLLRREPAPNHVDGRPTDERLARQGGEEFFEAKPAGKGEVTPMKRYRVKGPLEAHEEKFPTHIIEAFQNFRDDAEAAGITHVTANYDGGSGVVRGPKTGGLGAAATRDMRAAYWRHHFRVQMLECLSHERDFVNVVTVLNWILLQSPSRAGERVPSMAEIGRKLVPWFTQEATAKGVAWGWIEFAGRFLGAVDHALLVRDLSINGGGGLKLGKANRAYVESGALPKKALSPQKVNETVCLDERKRIARVDRK